MLRYIFAFLGIALAWALCLLLELTLWIAIAFTLVAIFGLGVAFFLGRRKAKRAASQLEAALSIGSQQQAGVRPDLQADVGAKQGGVLA